MFYIKYFSFYIVFTKKSMMIISLFSMLTFSIDSENIKIKL